MIITLSIGDAARAGLVGDHPSAQHVGSVLDRVFSGGRKLHATSFASTPRVDLRLHNDRATEFVGRDLRLFRRFRDAPRQYGNAVIFEKLLGLVLVEVHVAQGISGRDDSSILDDEFFAVVNRAESRHRRRPLWIPAFAGMTDVVHTSPMPTTQTPTGLLRSRLWSRWSPSP